MIEERIQEARKLHQLGRLAQAIDAYAAILAQEPKRGDVWHLKAVAEHQSGRLDAGLRSVDRAMEISGAQTGFVLLQAAMLHDRGNLAEAESRLAAVVAQRPDLAIARIDLGRVHMDQGRVSEALNDFRAAVDADAGNVRGWNNLGIAMLALERIDEAVRAFNHTLTLDPRYPLAHYNLARIHKLRGQLDRALEHARAAVQADTRMVEAWILVAEIHEAQRETENALAAYSAAMQAAPSNVAAPVAIGAILAKSGAYPEARTHYRAVAQRFPTSLRAALPAHLLLPQVYESAGQLEAVRADYAAGLRRLTEAARQFRLGSPEQALNEARWTNFYLAYQGANDVALQRRYGEFLRSVLAPAMPAFFEPRARRGGRSRIRVGFLSHFFFNCTAGRYFSSWITHLDRERFESVVYYTNDRIADDTRAIAAAAGTFKHRAGRSMYALAQEVAHDELDILVYPELGMHMENFTLAALRLAPVQCAAWGHPSTPGHPEIDWFISCAAMEPAHAREHYNERLALLPGLGTRYAVPSAEPEGTRADFGLPEDRTLYLVPQSLFKIHPANDDLVGEVLLRDPKGIAVMFASTQDRITETFAARLSKSLEARGIRMRDRVLLLPPTFTHPAYLRLNEVCDVMLDTVHWSGGNTSLDALRSGLPVVTRPGELMRGRQSQAMLEMLGVPELITADFDSQVATALRLGADADERRALSERIRAHRDRLFERDEPVRALEAFLEQAVRGA